MGTKPVHVLAGLALVGLLSSGCRNSSTVGGASASGSGSMSSAPGAYPRTYGQGRATVGGQVTTGGSTGVPQGGTAFSGNVAGGMSTMSPAAPGGMPATGQTMGSLNASGGMAIQGGNMSMGGAAGAATYSGSSVPSGRVLDDGAGRPGVTVVPQGQSAFGGTPQYQPSPLPPLTPGAAGN